MSSSGLSQPQRKQDRRASFFKLIDSFALEIGTLKKEMVRSTSESTEKGPANDSLHGLSGEVGGLFLQAPPLQPSTGLGAGPAGARDSGYDSPHRRMSVLDRVSQTHAIWLQLGRSHQDTMGILESQSPGTFVVRKSSSLQGRKVISLRMDSDSGTPIKDFPIKESQYTFSLEGSGLSFADLFRLVAFCCISRDVLPFTLKLPEAIATAKSPTDLEEVAKLGAGFWDSELYFGKKRTVSWSSPATIPPDRPPPPAQRRVTLDTSPGASPWLQTRTPSELECCQSNGALCFINPLFTKVHQTPPCLETTPDTPKQTSKDRPNEEEPVAGSDSSSSSSNQEASDDRESRGQVSSAELSEVNAWRRSPETLQPEPEHITRSDDQSPSTAIPSTSCSPPPPRPPPPRLLPRRPVPAPPSRQCSMPEKIPWVKEGEQDRGGEREKGGSLLHRLGSSLNISPFSSFSSFSTSFSSFSTSPPKKLSISLPISIPRPSLSSLPSSPRRVKASSSSTSQEEAMCHLALEEQTIENALIRSKLSRQNAIAPSSNYHIDVVDNPSASSQSPSDATPLERADGPQGGGGAQDGGGGGQRLSDMSLSTDSSEPDSLDLSHSQSFSTFVLPPLHDPSPPTRADYAAHLPLSLSPPRHHHRHRRHRPDSSMEEDEEEEEEEDEDDEEEPDFGVGLESDADGEQDQDLTLAAPGGRGAQRRRASAGALGLQKALQGHLRKMSGVFSSLLTPDTRAVRRVLQLSRDKSSYFGCLVQDYLSYMSEGTQAWQGHASGLELLQTLRQFMTQMKSYLRQSSELEPPIESLIPEDQIDQVLEKAMHKCVLKPLRGVVSAALREFQVRSGAWQELKENLAQAKARLPQDMGVPDTPPPDPLAVEKIRGKLQTLCKLYSPEKKVTVLLRVCKLIYTVMEDNSGRMYGADEFLPMLTYVLAQCDMPQLDNEILYMMELLDPSLLNGEGGYYLTSAYGAMSLIRNFQEEQAAQVLRTRHTLRQWHHRRTTQRSAPSVNDFQNYLRVALQELDSGCTAKTLSVRPYATAEEVCQLCANKFKVSEPESYALFLLTEGSSQQLAPDTHPQKIKAELHSRPQAPPFHFVYRRAGPTEEEDSPPVNLNRLPPTSDLCDLEMLDLGVVSSGPDPVSSCNSLSPSLSLSLLPRNLDGNSISV
ncbi:Ras and Rab interactor 2 [Merluccius polli]|uniref:Ras and Rab interactor 2 n=1 Tax=Merluccius polli TaxID=89951 RepID=A0AA47P2G3_MERPO|nr:Ras and Rab interactor 2 [Merluccius polli]